MHDIDLDQFEEFCRIAQAYGLRSASVNGMAIEFSDAKVISLETSVAPPASPYMGHADSQGEPRAAQPAYHRLFGASGPPKFRPPPG